MVILPYGFLTHEAEKIADRKARIAGMIACFSTHGVVEADVQLAERVSCLSRDWVRNQLAQPETATFHDEQVRLHPDNAVLLVGRVESQSVTGRTCSNWYIVQIDLARQAADGAVLDEQPRIQPVLPMPVMAGTQLPYQAPLTRPLPERPKPSYLGTNLLIVLVIALVVLVIAIVVAIV